MAASVGTTGCGVGLGHSSKFQVLCINRLRAVVHRVIVLVVSRGEGVKVRD